MAALPAPERHTFSIGPLCWAVTVTEFERWLASADPGARFVYAGGPVVPHEMAVVAIVREAVAAAEVTSHQRKVEGRWEYFVQRSRPDVEPRPGRSKRDAIPADSVKGLMLTILKAAATVGHPCPTNAEFAKRLGLKDAEAARYEFNQLAATGRIMVENRGPRQRRVVTIVSLGRSTAEGTL